MIDKTSGAVCSFPAPPSYLPGDHSYTHPYCQHTGPKSFFKVVTELLPTWKHLQFHYSVFLLHLYIFRFKNVAHVVDTQYHFIVILLIPDDYEAEYLVFLEIFLFFFCELPLHDFCPLVQLDYLSSIY